MYIILASQFESLVHPFTILLSLPCRFLSRFPLAAGMAGQTSTSTRRWALLVLFGVVKKNAILQIDHMNKLGRGLERLAAIIQGNRERLRPILMTTMTLMAGMLPLALGTGPGAEEAPRGGAVVVIGGQSLCLLLTLGAEAW
jgi:hydrophobic/amphiphilic exporter-1 (mainly G- bacteria), HAE1 family